MVPSRPNYINLNMSEINRLTAVSDCFKLLAACFYEPDKLFFQEQRVCENLVMLLEQFSTQAAHHAQTMANSLEKLDQNILMVDYAALFVGPFELLAAPYGSIYLEKKREVMGQSTMEVLKYYQDAGLEVQEAEPADHIAIELEFLSFLYSKEARTTNESHGKSAGDTSELRYRFLTACFFPWVFDFCEAIQKGTSNAFYLSLAHCLASFVRDHQAHIMETA